MIIYFVRNEFTLSFCLLVFHKVGKPKGGADLREIRLATLKKVSHVELKLCPCVLLRVKLHKRMNIGIEFLKLR